MKIIITPFLMGFALMSATALGGTAPNYTLSKVPDPPSKFQTNQIDGMAFLPDGRMVVCLPSGEIFFYHTEKDKWHLFAEGLHNPLGVVVLSNSDLVISSGRKNGARTADMVIEIAEGGIYAELLAQDALGTVLGRGLAVGSGDGDDGDSEFGAIPFGESLQGFEGILDQDCGNS